MVIQLLPALIPLGASLAKVCHFNRPDEDGLTDLSSNAKRGRFIIDKMVKGGANAPITSWSEAKLEKAIIRNSVFREHADELRLARVNGLASKLTTGKTEVAKAKIPILTRTPSNGFINANADADSVFVKEEGQGSTVPDTFCEADLLLLAAEAKPEAAAANSARDAALEALADNSFDALLITDVKGIIAYSNKAFSKLTGYAQDEVLGKSPKLLQGPGTDRKVLNRLKESMQQGNGDYEGSAINYRKDGTPFIMWWRVVPVKVAGEITAWVAIQREGSQIPSADMS